MILFKSMSRKRLRNTMNEEKLRKIFKEISNSLLKGSDKDNSFQQFESFVNNSTAIDKYISHYKKEYLQYMFNDDKSDFIKFRWADGQIRKKINLKLPSKLKDINKIKYDTSVLDLYFILFIGLKWKQIDLNKYLKETQSKFNEETKKIRSLSQFNTTSILNNTYLEGIPKETIADISFLISLYIPTKERDLLNAVHILSNHDPFFKNVLSSIYKTDKRRLNEHISRTYTEYVNFNYLFTYLESPQKKAIAEKLHSTLTIDKSKVEKLTLKIISQNKNFTILDYFEDSIQSELKDFVKSLGYFSDYDLTSLSLFIHEKHNGDESIFFLILNELILDDIRNLFHLFSYSHTNNAPEVLEDILLNELTGSSKPSILTHNFIIKELSSLINDCQISKAKEIMNANQKDIHYLVLYLKSIAGTVKRAS